MKKYNIKMRQVTFSVTLALLVVTAGCSSFLTDGNSPTPAAEGPNQQVSPTPSGGNTSNGTVHPSNRTAIPSNGTDLRSVSVPEEHTDRTTIYGEIDGSDPVINGTERYYEPVLFAAEVGDTINVTMSSIAHDPELRLRSPNGSTIAIDDDGADGNNAAFERFTFNQTGQYTLVASAAEPNTGFDYTLTVERYRPNEGETPVSATEASRYNEFALDFIIIAQYQSGGRDRFIDEGEEPLGNITAFSTRAANASTDEAVVGYYMDENMSTREAIDADVSLVQSYALLYESYIADDGSVENSSWIPDRIYQTAYTRDGELFRVTYIERDWAVEYYEAGLEDNQTALSNYLVQFYGTIRHGPAHPQYNEDGGANSVDPSYPLTGYEEFENGTFQSGEAAGAGVEE